jgi:REP element-mobilizing transposase RayT
LDAVREVCRYQDWRLHAAHVRSTHVHVVATASIASELMLGKFKAYASRALNRERGRLEKRWAHHGSTIYLWRAADVHDAVEYVYARQGAPMARYVNGGVWPQFLLDDEQSIGGSWLA